MCRRDETIKGDPEEFDRDIYGFVFMERNHVSDETLRHEKDTELNAKLKHLSAPERLLTNLND